MLPVDGASQVQDVNREDADAAPANCYATWLDHSVHFQPPTLLGGINTTSSENDPFLSPDERTIYFSSDRSGSMGFDVWMATRAMISDTFSTPVPATPFNSTSDESKISITANGLTAVVPSNRPGTAGSFDVWEATRAPTSASWPAFT